MFVSVTPGYNNNRPANQPSAQGVKPGVSDDSSQSKRADSRGTGREEIAQADDYQEDYYPDNAPYPRTGHFRMGDWDFRENWRYNRDAFYRGETQPQAYREEHPYGPGGIGYDADVNYMRNLKRYRELYQKHPSARNKDRIENYVNPYHVQPYRGRFWRGKL